MSNCMNLGGPTLLDRLNPGVVVLAGKGRRRKGRATSGVTKQPRFQEHGSFVNFVEPRGSKFHHEAN
jgi:hypothetical protein